MESDDVKMNINEIEMNDSNINGIEFKNGNLAEKFKYNHVISYIMKSENIEMNEIIAYYDGACEPKNPKGVATYGFVIYKNGEKIGWERGLATEPWSENASNNVAEYTAMIQALNWLIEHGLTNENIIIRGDSQLSIMQMKGLYEVKALRILPLYKKAKELVKKFKKIRFEWVPREENEEADLLSEQALKDYWITHKFEKAEEINLSEIKYIGNLKFKVKSYIVDLKAYTCNCPDYKYSNRNPRLKIKIPCKHLIAVENLKNQV